MNIIRINIMEYTDINEFVSKQLPEVLIEIHQQYRNHIVLKLYDTQRIYLGICYKDLDTLIQRFYFVMLRNLKYNLIAHYL